MSLIGQEQKFDLSRFSAAVTEETFPIDAERESKQALNPWLGDKLHLPSVEEISAAFPSLSDNSETDLEWKKFLSERGYQVWTKELINSLADRLKRVIDGIPKNTQVTDKAEPVLVLEVGAGNGLLTYFLKKKFEEAGWTADFIASDDNSWSLGHESLPEVSITRISCKAAMKRYQGRATIVICSWMPPLGFNEEWSALFRQQPNIYSYLLIGDEGGSGAGFRSWESGDDFIKEDLTDQIDGNFGVLQRFSPHSGRRASIYLFSRLLVGNQLK